MRGGYLPDRYAVVGFSRTPMSDEVYREGMLTALREQVKGDTIDVDHPIVQALHYQAGDADNPATFQELRTRLEAIEKERGLPGNRLFYLSVAPEFFPLILENLSGGGLIRQKTDATWSRVIIEKPFGTDLTSARALNAIVGATSTRARSTASTTTSGKRPSRTS
jgi:glucose-6-phosphate 1-dehydrogenase